MKIGYLGPRGTFTEEAVLKNIKIVEKDLKPFSTVFDVIMAVEKNEVDKGIVPIENSIEGPINATLDMLAFESDLLIEKEIVVHIKHNLIGKPKTSLSDVNKIISHPQATAQCRKFLRHNLPDVPVEAANSTAEAVMKASNSNGKVVAIGTKLAAKIYGLEVLTEDIEDFEDNLTRFVILGREQPKSTGFDKTSIVCFIYEDRPGSLLQILQEFAFRYINLTKISSRPTKKGLGDYCFFIDMEGHIEDEVVSSAVKCLECKIRKVKILGSYPRSR
jgi:prephenate dehydratase